MESLLSHTKRRQLLCLCKWISISFMAVPCLSVAATYYRTIHLSTALSSVLGRSSFSFSTAPTPTTITFLGGRLSNPHCRNEEETTLSCTQQIRSILSPPSIWVWGSMNEVMLMGALVRGRGFLCWNPDLLLPAPSPNGHLHSLNLQGLWRPGGHCCHCFLKMVDPAAAWAQPCSTAQFVDKEQMPTVFQPGLTGAACRWFHA